MFKSIAAIALIFSVLCALALLACQIFLYQDFSGVIAVPAALTIRRLDLLEKFLDYYEQCPHVDQVQVIWSDQVNKAPIDWLSRYTKGKVIFEIHLNNSLSNRFRPKLEIRTEAVLSIDDDLIVPCTVLDDAMSVWMSNRRALVGFSPRMHAFDINSGLVRYLRWQHSWWSGMYTIMLTKVSLLHKDYLHDFGQLPQQVYEYIDNHRNCEDIAMAHVVAVKSRAAPVWVKGIVYEVSTSGISSGSNHFMDRGKCLAVISGMTGQFPWVTGYQKMIKLSWSDFLTLCSVPSLSPLSNKLQ